MTKFQGPIHVHRLNGGKPIVAPVPGHPWENKVAFNPACAFVTDRNELLRIIDALPFSAAEKNKLAGEKGLCFLLYRAQGALTETYDHRRSSVGLAVLSPRLELLARHTEPVLRPDSEFDNLGVEDGRITKIGNRYFMVYTAYASAAPENKIRIALASTTDFVHWEKHGLLRGSFNTLHNKNGMIFDSPVGGRYLMLHRPMVGAGAMAIHWASATEIFGEWQDHGLLMASLPDTGYQDRWVGGGAPPLALGNQRFLMLYHTGNRLHNGEREYDLGIAVGEFSSGGNIVKRDEPLMRPETPAETVPAEELGLANVLFVCGGYFFEGDFYFPYAGADTVVLGGMIAKKDLEAYVAG